MKFPQLSPTAASREMLSNFAGYNHNLKIRDAEFYDMRNMTSSYYPVLSPRDKRAISSQLTEPRGLIAKDALYWVDGTDFYANGLKIQGLVLTDTEKQLVSMGAYILIFPDNIRFNTIDNSYEYLENRTSTKSGDTYSALELSLSKADGSAISNYSQTEPEEPSNGDLWLDTSGEKHILKQWSESTGMWTQVATTYVKIYSTGIGAGFSKFDGVTVSGLTGAAEQFNGTQLIQAVDTNYVVIIGIIDSTMKFNDGEGSIAVNAEIKVERKVPKMDFYTESENRIWGCKYGTVDGKTVNEIYACALGDPKNWNQFRGISTDSYAVSLGTDGVFTGAITHGGYPLFFKENCIHKIFGNLPSNYQVLTTNARGVQQGSEKSLVIVNERLYYKSALDICVYDGSLPASISDALGHEHYISAVAGDVNGKYYISMQDDFGEWHLFVYDTFKSLWHKEDNTHALFFARVRNKFFYIDADDKKIYSPTGDCPLENISAVSESDVPWMIMSGIMGYDLPDNKYNSRFNLRMSIEPGAYADIEMEYDSSGVWEHKAHLTGNSLRSFTIPVIPRRCDHMRLKISGKGNMKLYSVTKIVEQGSDV